MGSDLSLQSSALVSLYVETALFGLFTAVFFIALYIYWSKRHRSNAPANKIILLIMFAMYLLAAGHSALGLARVLCAFITHAGTEEDFLGTVSNPFYLAQMILYGAQTSLGDIFLMYRTYIIWGRRIWIIVLSCVFLIGILIVDISCVFVYTRASSSVDVFQLLPWTLAFFILTLVINVICASLISLKIWATRQDLEAGHFTPCRSGSPALRLVIESGVLYTILLVTTVVLYAGSNWDLYVMLDALMQFIGLVFSLIVLRVAFGISVDSYPEGARGASRLPGILRGPEDQHLPLEVQMTRNCVVSDDMNVVLGFKSESVDGRSLSTMSEKDDGSDSRCVTVTLGV